MLEFAVCYSEDTENKDKCENYLDHKSGDDIAVAATEIIRTESPVDHLAFILIIYTCHIDFPGQPKQITEKSGTGYGTQDLEYNITPEFRYCHPA